VCDLIGTSCDFGSWKHAGIHGSTKLGLP